MIKKSYQLISFLTGLVLVLNLFCVNAYCAEAAKIRQIDARVPDVRVEVAGSFSKDDVKKINLKDEKLQINKAYKASKAKSKLVYILVDVSGSMNQRALNLMKPRIIDYADSLKDKDKLVLMTFGTEVKTLLKGGESKSKVHEVINGITCNSGGTTFYQALEKAFDASVKEKGFTRKLAFVISDGANVSKGDAAKNTVTEKYSTNRLPLYALCLDTADQDTAGDFRELSMDKSGGSFTLFNVSNAASRFDDTIKTSNNVTIIEATSRNKKSLGVCNIQVEVKGDDGSIKESDEAYVSAKEDKTKPSVEKVDFDKESNSFLITFSEDVEKANDLSSYTVKKKDKEFAAVSVKYRSKDYVAELKMEDKIYTGTYTVEFKNITDTSDNQNALENSVVEQEFEANSQVFRILKIVGLALLPVLFFLALFLMLLAIKKKKKVNRIKDIFVEQEEITESEHVRIEQPKGRKITVNIQAGDGTTHNVQYNLVKSMIVGRSDICDLTIQDPVLSRQHFVVEDIENGLAVTDLETTNGTFVNGVEIKSRTYLDNHSVITAGNSIIKISY